MSRVAPPPTSTSGPPGRRELVRVVPGARRRPPGASRREQGVALVLVLSTVSILGVVLYDMQESAAVAHAVGVARRDEVQAEFMARSGLQLTRLLVASEERIRTVVAPLYQMLLRRPPPQLPVWTLADEVLAPFCDWSNARERGDEAGIDFGAAQGLGETPGTCSIVAVAENAKINVNDPLLRDGDEARRSVAMQMFALMGGYHAPSPFDPLFERPDAEGRHTSRLDVVSALVDWWDGDTERTLFDPGAGRVQSGGPEDDVYRTYADPYFVKNAPFDSLEELRLVRGVGDDFWATFVEPVPDDLQARTVTVYGSGAVNPNEAPPEVLLARLCSHLGDQPLCADPREVAKFIELVRTVRAIAPLPFFSRASDFLTFVEGGGGPHDLYPMLRALLGADHPLLFRPVTIPADRRVAIENDFVTAARILTIESTGVVGRARVRLRAVVNFHDQWTPPPPNAGRMPPLGVVHHYRVD
ncbi:MAG: general secretion pathway protein GspK [Myxococcota bacterium]|nr:general secretion pathway protein GspK [Myxococcota bacterium]MDW8360822.1 type II secretion system protein GspK [Myxococcales bacterium]